MNLVHTPTRAEQAQACDVATTAQALEFRRPTLYHGQLLRRRGYLSQRDADAYDTGVVMFKSRQDLPDGVMNTPMSQGWYDAESAELDRMDRVWVTGAAA